MGVCDDFYRTKFSNKKCLTKPSKTSIIISDERKHAFHRAAKTPRGATLGVFIWAGAAYLFLSSHLQMICTITPAAIESTNVSTPSIGFTSLP